MLLALPRLNTIFATNARKGDNTHLYLDNTLTDFRKSRDLQRQGVRLQAIVLAADYRSMPPDGAKLGLYRATEIHRFLAKHGAAGFAAFENDLFTRLQPACKIFPNKGARAKTWQAKHQGASAAIRAWVAEMR